MSPCILWRRWAKILGSLMAVRGVAVGVAMGALLCGVMCEAARGQAVAPPKELVATLLQHERAAAERKGLYEYVSKERSDRTGGHLWTEKVAETRFGKVRMLVAEDDAPLSPERAGQERGRLAGIVADPEGFAKKEQALKNDEAKAKQMLELLPKAFLFENARMEGGYERIDFRPNPEYQPQSLEERVLHAMTGSMLVDPKTVRLHRLEGVLPQDVSIGFGILATIHAGSRFATERSAVPTGEWKTTLIDTDINGRAIFFKAISRRQHSEHRDFRPIAENTTVVQAVALVEQ